MPFSEEQIIDVDVALSVTIRKQNRQYSEDPEILTEKARKGPTMCNKAVLSFDGSYFKRYFRIFPFRHCKPDYRPLFRRRFFSKFEIIFHACLTRTASAGQPTALPKRNACRGGSM